MGQVVIRFVKPNSFFGRLITWRLGEPWSHVVIMFIDTAYSAQMPKVTHIPLDHRNISVPPRHGVDADVEVSDEEYAKMKEWCESRLGQPYDFMSIFGWLLGWNWLQNRRNSYCFEFVRECLEHMEWLTPDKTLIKGNRLIEDIKGLIDDKLGDLDRKVEITYF